MISLSRTWISRALPRGRRAPALFRLVAALSVAAAGLVPVEGWAAKAGATVGSHVPQGPAGAVRALAVIDREDIALSGMRTVSELLSSQRRFTRYGLLSRQRLSRFGLHRTLLLEDRVAYLVNGRRIADSAVDLSTLPAAAVERIEVLQGGAAALHGRHAVAGAINIVLKRGDDGVEVAAVADRPTQPGGDVEQAGIRWGGALGRGHLTVIADVLRREEIPEAARAYSAASWTPGGRFADAAGISVGGNTVFVATRSYDDNGAVASVHVPAVAGSSIARPLGNCPKDRYAGVLSEPLGTPGRGCGFSYADRAWGMQREERQSVFLALDHPLGSRTDAYLDIRVAGGETRERYAPAVGTFSVSSEALREVLLPDPEIDSLPGTVRVSHRFLGHGDREWRTSLEEHDVTLGLEGKSAGVGFDAYLRYYRRDAGGVGDTFVSRSAIQEFINAGRYDLVNPWSPGNRDAYRETALRQSRVRVTDHRSLRVSMNGPMFALSGGAAQWAAGVELSSENWRDVHEYRDHSGRSRDASDALGAGGGQAAGDRRRGSGFAELRLPVRAGWDVALAGRADTHDDVGAAHSLQLASRLRLHDAVTLRGSWDRGSRAPSLYELHLRSSDDFPYVCDRKSHVGALATCPVEQFQRVSGGNPHLEPDHAEGVSLGVVLGLGPLTFSADWFRIALSDVPAQLLPQSIMDLEARDALPSGVAVVRSQEGRVERIVSPIVNSGETAAAGVDVQARVGWTTTWADLELDAGWLHRTRHETRVAGERQPGDHPRDHVHGSLRLSQGDLTVNWRVYAVSGYWNARRTGRFGGWVGQDLAIRWRDAFGLGGFDLTGGVLNIGDRDPSVDPTDPDAQDVNLDSGRGRTIFLTAARTW